jgi:hypothetical protein
MVEKLGRPQHKVTDENKKIVKALVAYGIPHIDVARKIGCNQDTLRKHYREELDDAMTEANGAVGQYLFGLATGKAMDKGATHGDCSRAAIFWAKTRMGWKDTTAVELSGPEGKPIEVMTIAAHEAKLKLFAILAKGDGKEVD